MKLAIAARALSLPFGGVRTFLEQTLPALMQQAGEHSVTVYYDDDRHLGLVPGAREVVLRAPHKALWDHVVLPVRLRADTPDVVWYPQNVVSLGVQIPTVVTIHDMLYFSLPAVAWREYAWPDTFYARVMIPRSVAAARVVACDSAWTARDVQRVTGAAPRKLRVVHLGTPSDMQPASSAEVDLVCAELGISKPYLLYCGTNSPRKNLRVLLAGFARVQDQIPHTLLIVGGNGYREVELDDLLAPLAGRVLRLPLVSRSELAALYSGATAFVFPSRYEGFGIPPLEAMACGCPVVCSAATSLPEVVADAALTFHPDDPATLARHLVALAHDPDLRTDLGVRGRARAAELNVARTAAAMWQIFGEVCL